MLVCGCEADEELPVAPAPEAIFSGCVEFGPDTCILEGPTRLSIWLDVHPATPLLVRIDGEPVPATGRVIQGGVRLAVEVPRGAEVVRVETPAQTWSPEVTIALEWRARPPIDDLSSKDLRAFANKNSGWAKLRALEKLRRRSKGHPAGLPDGEAELALARQLGAVHHQASVLGQRAHTFIEFTRDAGQARAALDELKPLGEVSPFASARWQYHNAVLARHTGDLGSAIDGFENARTLSERVNFGVTDVVDMLASTYAELGRDDEARPLFRQLEDNLWEHGPACSEWTRIANNLAWGQLVLGSAGHEHEDPRPLLLAALERCAACPNTMTEASLLLDLALAELEYGKPLDAQGWIAQIGAQPEYLRGWIEMTALAVALELGDESSQPPLILEPAHADDIELAWNQRVRRGDLLTAWGFHALAAETYEAAEAELRVTFEQVGTGEGGEMYVAGRMASLEGLVEALLQVNQLADASCAIRLARAQEFGRLDRTARLGAATEDERAHWERELIEIVEERRTMDGSQARLWELSETEQLQASAKLSSQARRNRERLDAAVRELGLHPSPRSCVALRPASEGEVILVAFMSRVFALSGSGVEVSQRTNLSSIEALATASRITLLDTEVDQSGPLHLASWRHADSLIDLAPIGYSLDLPPRVVSTAEPRAALVLADPRGDLPNAHTEADTVRRTLAAGGCDVIDLRGSDATRSNLFKHAAAVDLLHYAGHGVRSGQSGWDSALLLADDARLGIHDVFTLPGVPRGVVLTGCETAAPNPDTVGGGMNIGRAFVLSGSDWVIAADAEVADRFAADVGAAVHSTTAQDGPTRLREALLRLRSDDPELPWEQFRVITP